MLLQKKVPADKSQVFLYNRKTINSLKKMKYRKFKVKNQNKKTIFQCKKTNKKDKKRSKNKNNQNQCIRINKT
jgi:hypothetical protein